jgi:anti-sigma regulatory factor (Ser/Thr protein kinase)
VIERQDQWSAAAAPPIVGELRRSVTTFAADAGFAGTRLDDLRSCLSEAITNAIVHAYRDGRAPGTVVVHAELFVDELVITVNDDGAGFTARTDSPGLGLGIPTIAALTSSMSIGRSAAGGTRVCMAFDRHAAGR